MSFREDLITDSRKEAALNKKQTPLKLFPETQSGIFSSSEGGFYETNLDNCSCPDFAIQGHLQPCKHMIRLAMEFGLIDNAGMQSDRDAAVVKYYVGMARDLIHSAPLADVIPGARLFVQIFYGEAKVPDDAFAQFMDLPTLSDCPMFKVFKNGSVRIEKKYAKDAQSVVTVLKNRLGEEATLRLWNDDFIHALIGAEE